MSAQNTKVDSNASQENYDPKAILVPIKTNQAQNHPFNQLPSLLVTANVLSFVGKLDAVFELLQRINHSSRFYGFKQKSDALKGFVLTSSGKSRKLAEKNQLRVQVDEPWKFSLPFSNVCFVRPTHLICAYYGKADFVCRQLQQLSKSSRAFCI